MPQLSAALHQFRSFLEGASPRGDNHCLIEADSPTVAAVFAAQAQKQGRMVVVVCAKEKAVPAELESLGFLLGGRKGTSDENDPVAWFPAVEHGLYSEVEADRLPIMRRLAVLNRLVTFRTPFVLCLSITALLRKTLPRSAFVGKCHRFKRGEHVERETLIEGLVGAGYTRAPIVDDPGTFAIRGAVVDLYSPNLPLPARLEFDDDVIQEIRLFDPETQRTLRPVETIHLHPVRETIVSDGADPRARLLAAADQATYPSSKTRHLLERIESGEPFLGMDSLTPIFHARMSSVLEYLPPNTCFFAEDWERVLEDAEEGMAKARELARRKRDTHQLALEPEEFLVTKDELSSAIREHILVEAPLLRIEKATNPTTVFSVSARDTHGIRAELVQTQDFGAALQNKLQRWITDGMSIILAVRGHVHADRLAGLLASFGLASTRVEAGEAFTLLSTAKRKASAIRLAEGTLRRGLELPEDGLVLVTEEELFGERTHHPPARRASEPFGDLSAIQENDLVVHEEHGVGRYRGLLKLSVRGVTQDFVHLQYDGGTLYLPVYRVGVLRRFAGEEAQSVRLDKLGGSTWTEKRRKVRTEARKMAEELLQLYAQRKALPGHAFPAPDIIFREFEETFPFDETPDQMTAIEAVLGDMQATAPMDRLVCGDVGYGKTEVALRAALLAVLGGKQVAVLCPTTVLAEQHSQTFGQRLQGFPVTVASLSRFRSLPEQRKVVRAVAEGSVDIVVGTHRLLSRDVAFKNLGLLVVDEEQRFGVAHKERIKEMRTNVDVLTLTATPIPRTLHMALAGMREISVIATPPADRLSIRTFVCHFDPELLGEAIEKELSRGGQVFFIHNRVEDLAKWAKRVQTIAPAARVAMAHGQMESAQLEKVMYDFVRGKHDILCCTSIVESGLDIPRANTMIVNNADRFGLTQLYQLRGRIGRARDRAYCYLVLPQDQSVSDEARQRLAVLQRFTELGAGFQVATADLEIRGAGELLGAKQSGLLAAVGFETYTRILEEAVAELHGEPIREEHDPEVSVDLPAFLPDDYIPDTGQRLEIYRQLAKAKDEEEVQGHLASVIDRYGPLPEEAVLLGEVMVHKTLVRLAGARAYDLGPVRFVVALGMEPRLDSAKVMRLVQKRDTRWKLSPDMRLSYAFTESEREDRLPAARFRLNEMLSCLAP